MDNGSFIIIHHNGRAHLLLIFVLDYFFIRRVAAYHETETVGLVRSSDGEVRMGRTAGARFCRFSTSDVVIRSESKSYCSRVFAASLAHRNSAGRTAAARTV